MENLPNVSTGNGAGPAETKVPPEGETIVHSAVMTSGRYEVLEEIGRGGMGVVYRATDTVLGRPVAFKVLQDRFEPGSGAGRRFVGEARIAGQLQHPGVPSVHELGTLPDGRPFLAMRLIKGRTLEELIKQRGSHSPDLIT